MDLTFPERLEAIGLRVNAMRDLSSEDSVVEHELLTEEELSDLVLELFEEDREDIEKEEELFKVLGILRGEQDLYEILTGLYTGGVLGLYRAEENKFYLLGESDDFGPHEEMIYVHEFTHALQQLHFDFDGKFDAIEDNTDASYALRALVEGGARVSELLYMQEFLTEEEQAESQGSPNPGPHRRFPSCAVHCAAHLWLSLPGWSQLRSQSVSEPGGLGRHRHGFLQPAGFDRADPPS